MPDYTCALCGESFESTAPVVVPDKLSDEEKRQHAIENLQNLIHSCTKCFFTSISHDEDIDEEMRNTMIPELRLLAESESPVDSITKYKLYALTTSGIYNSSLMTADAFFRAYRVARHQIDSFDVDQWKETSRNTVHAKMVDCGRRALACFKIALKRNEVEDKDKIQICHIIGEIHQQLGDSEDAVTWFEKIPAEHPALDELVHFKVDIKPPGD